MGYIKQLDGLRCIAISLVLIAHFAPVIGQQVSVGYYGVNLFFVLSGFLITGILLKQEEPFLQAYTKFIGRRTLRIFPIYYLTIAVLLLVGSKYVSQYLFYCLTYTYNYAWVYFDIPLNEISHLWSLCVEEQFYLFWPFLILGFRNKLGFIKYAIAVIILFCSLQLYFNLITQMNPYNNVGLIPQANALAAGALGAVLQKQKRIGGIIMKSKWIELFAAILLVPLLISTSNIKYVLCPFISLFFILKAANGGFSSKKITAFLENKKVVYVGSISYGLYLYHIPLTFYFTEHFFMANIWNNINFNALGIFKGVQSQSWIFKLPLFSLAAILLAHLSYQYIEKPILSLKEKWFGYR